MVLLEKLRFRKKKHTHQNEYQLWQEEVHPKQIDSEEKMRSCLEYIHANPVKADYVDDPINWRYSWAINYQNKPGLIEVSLYGR